MYKILVAEDDEAIANLIRINLRKAGYLCTWACDGKEAADLMESSEFDLALLDIMLPYLNGYELMDYAASLRLPVIFITAMGSTMQKVKGLKMGAEDYIAKPFDIAELLARVEVVLRRFHKAERFLKAHGIVADTESYQVMKDGEEISLTPKEYELLLLFMRNKNIALSREVIYEKVWESDYIGESRTVDLHIQRLKKKLGWEECMKTVYKIGYRLEE